MLVIGRDGQLARCLAEAAPGATFLGRETVDLSDPAAAGAALAAALARSGEKLVVNAAAYTAVDKAESEPELAQRVNGEAPGALARAAAQAGAAFVHVSTDYVFDGSGDRAWRETDPTGPLGVYGATKLAGERAALAANPRTLVMRTAWVYSPFGRNFVKTMIGLAGRERLTVVADQVGNPTSAVDIAEAIAAIAPRLEEAPAGSPAWGIFHYGGAGAIHWAGFAEAIFATAKAAGLIDAAPQVTHIPTSDYPTPARRPANSRLDCTKFEAVFGLAPRPWQVSLERVVARLAAGEA